MTEFARWINHPKGRILDMVVSPEQAEQAASYVEQSLNGRPNPERGKPSYEHLRRLWQVGGEGEEHVVSIYGDPIMSNGREIGTRYRLYCPEDVARQLLEENIISSLPPDVKP